MATESRGETIMALLQDRLEAIVGDAGQTAWYTPTKVARQPALKDVLKDPSLETLYVMVPDRAVKARANGCLMGVDMGFDLVLCRRFPGSGETWTDGEDRTTVQKRLAQDATNVLESLATLNALQAAGVNVSEVIVEDDIGSPEETWIAGWVEAFLGVTVRYRYQAGAFGMAS